VRDGRQQSGTVESVDLSGGMGEAGKMSGRTQSKVGSSRAAAAEPRRKIRLAPEARRSQIIQEAARLISQSGFNAVSLADIADACGLRKPSVLHYFPSMNALLAAVLAHRDKQDIAVVAPAEPERMTGPATVRASVMRFVEHNLTQREIIRLHHMLAAEALAPDHPAHSYFAERSRRALIEVSRGLAWKPDPVASAIELLAFWEGIELAWLRDPDLDQLAVWESFCDRFFV
jgi:AcrR family transcriptional regulator